MNLFLKNNHQKLLIANHPPVVYRYMDKVYIDEFFETGKLRLGSFQHYIKLDGDTIRGDKGEGFNIFVIRDRKLNFTLFVVGLFGISKNWSLSTSTIFSRRLLEKFNTDDAIGIRDSVSFAHSVAKAINEKVPANILMGRCNYMKDKVSLFDSWDDFVNEVNPSEEVKKAFLETKASEYNGLNKQEEYTPLDQMPSFRINIAKFPYPLFNKTMIYSDQFEFRFLWETQDDLESTHLEIQVPDATQYCFRPQHGFYLAD